MGRRVAGRQRADAGSESRLVAARCAGRGRALANGTRGDRNVRTRIGSPSSQELDRVEVMDLGITTRIPSTFVDKMRVHRMISTIRTRRVE
jgi:hypothetical protein